MVKSIDRAITKTLGPSAKKVYSIMELLFSGVDAHRLKFACDVLLATFKTATEKEDEVYTVVERVYASRIDCLPVPA